MTSLNAVITEILRSRDFEVSERDGLLFGKKGGNEVVFFLVSEGGKDSVDLPDRFKDFRGRKVVASLKHLPDSLVEEIDPTVIYWDREAIALEIGRTRIEGIVGEHDHGLVDELIADDYPKMVSPEELDRVQSAEVGERIVRPIVDIKDVKEISRQTVGGFRFRLELVPYFVYKYACDLYVDGKRIGKEEGQLSVNALTKKVETWDEKVEIVYTLEQNHKRLEPALDAEEARSLAEQEVVRHHTSEREVIRDSGQATVMERKIVSPKEDEIVLEDMGIFYAPIWCVEGIHGVMIVNAGTGKIISEDYYKI